MHAESNHLSTGESTCTSRLVSFRLGSHPIAPMNIQAAATEARMQLEMESVRAQLACSQLAVVELFSVLCRHAPELLPAAWAPLYDLICAEERFWVFPRVTLGDIEDGLGEAFTPYLNTACLAAEWEALLRHAAKVSEAQESGRRHVLPA